MSRQVVVVLALLALAQIAEGAGPELTLSAGLRAGTVVFTSEAESSLIVCVTTPCVTTEVRTEDDEGRLTLILDVPVTRRWMVELLLTEQDGDHEFRSDDPSLVERGSYEWMTAQVGVLRQWGDGRVRPFVAGTLGGSRFESTVGAYDLPLSPGTFPTPVDEEVLSGTLVAGVKIGLSRHLDVRLEGRGWWHDFPVRLGGSLWQREGSVGLTYRW